MSFSFQLLALQTTIVEYTHAHKSVRLNIALICLQWAALRKRQLGIGAEDTTTKSTVEEEGFYPTPNPDFDFALPSSLESSDADFGHPLQTAESSNSYPTPNPDFDYSLPFLP